MALQLTPEQSQQRDRFFKALTKNGVSACAASKAAEILMQDSIFGIDARTEDQRCFMVSLITEAQ